MGEGIKMGSGSSSIRNAIIKEYVAETGTIKSNTYLQYVATRTLKTEVEKIQSGAQNDRFVVESVSDDRFLLYYKTNNKVYASLCKINPDNSVSILTNVFVGSSSTYGFGMVKLSENRFFCITYLYMAVVLTVSGDTIQVGTITEYITGKSPSFLYEYMSVVQNNIVVIPFFDGSTGSPTQNKALVATVRVDGTSISKVQVVELGVTFPNNNAGSDNLRCLALSNDKVCVISGALSGTSNAPQIRGTIISVDAAGKMAINATNVIMNNNGYIGLAVQFLDSTHFILSWCVNTTRTQIGVVTVNANNTFSMGTRLSLTGTANYSFDMELAKYDESTYLATNRSTSGSENKIYGYVLKLSADNVFSQLSRSNLDLTAATTYQRHTVGILPALFGFFILMEFLYSNTEISVYSQAFSLEEKIICKPYVNTVYGVSKTRATTTKSGKAMIPQA